MPIEPNAGETKEEFVSRCISEEISAGYEQDMAAAICYSKWDRKELSKQKLSNAQDRVSSKLKFDSKYRGINLLAAEDEDPCQEGYRQLGTKILDGREVPACIPEEEHPDNK